MKHLKRLLVLEHPAEAWNLLASHTHLAFSHSAGVNIASSLLLTCLDGLIMADTNCSPLQKNSKGENRERRRRRQTDRGDRFCRAYVQPRSPFQFYQRVRESFLIHGPRPPHTPHLPSRACLRLHRCQETSRQREYPAGWQRLLLGFLKPNYGA